MQSNLKFSPSEFADRLAKTRKAMEAKGVDLLIVSDPSNMAWLTGYDGWSFYVHQAVIVPLRASRSGMAAARTPTARSAPLTSPTTTSSVTPTITCSRPSGTRWTTSPACWQSAAGTS
jgi:Xaa-Pro aminopeptidase